MVSDEFSKVETELREIFRLLKTNTDPSERSLLLQDCDMLLKLAGRLIRARDQRIGVLRNKARTRRLDLLRQQMLSWPLYPKACLVRS